MDSRTSSEMPSAIKPGLQPDTDLPNGYYSHPDLPNKVFRWTEHSQRSFTEFVYHRQLLADLETIYNIPTVHTEFIVSEVPDGEYDDVLLIMMSDKISHGITAKEAFQDVADNEALADEFDGLSCKILRHLDNVATNGGAYAPDFYYYDQYMLDPERPQNERLVLVDTEPIVLCMEEHPSLRLKGSVPVTLLMTVADVAKDIIRLQTATGRISNAQLQLPSIIDKFDPEGYESVELLKQAIIAAVQRNDESLLDFLETDDGLSDYKVFHNVIDSWSFVHKLKEQGRI